MEYFLLVPLVAFIFFFHKWFFSPSNTQKRLLPPSLTKLPIIGNLHQLGSLPHRSLKLSKKYGPVMLLHFGSKPVLAASSVDAARDIMKTHDLVWSNRPKTSMTDGLFYGSKGVAFSLYGEYWRQMRSVTMYHLLNNKRVQSYRHVREEEISNMIEKIRQECDSSNLVVIDLRDVLSCMTNNIISRVNIGRTYNEGESGITVKALLEEILVLTGTFNIGEYILWLKWLNKINGLDTRVKKVVEGLDAFLESVIEELMIRNKKAECTKGEAKDFVGIFLEIQNGKDTGFPIQRDSLKPLILVNFLSLFFLPWYVSCFNFLFQRLSYTAGRHYSMKKIHNVFLRALRVLLRKRICEI